MNLATKLALPKAGVILRRIIALRDFGNVKAGDKGGFVESERNLSHEGNAWVSGDALVSGNAWVKYSRCDFDCCDPANVVKMLKCSMNIASSGGLVRLFKYVRKDWTSLYDRSFSYPQIGKITCNGILDYSVSCSSGMHWSTASYWENDVNKEDSILIAADIPVNSILAVAEGKVRCSEAYILGKCDE